MPRGIPNARTVEQQTGPDETAPATARAVETRRERRRRDDGDLDRGARFKLAIPKHIQEKADREGKTLRWVNDEGNRMHDLTVDDDWDVVPDSPKVPVSTAPDGSPVYARLCAKDKDWYDADQRAKAKVLNEMERAVERGGKANEDDSLPDDVRYAAKGNRISRGA